MGSMGWGGDVLDSWKQSRQERKRLERALKEAKDDKERKEIRRKIADLDKRDQARPGPANY